MAVDEKDSIRVRGDDLRVLRKRRFKSADAFSAACESVSVPTIYRAERGGPVLRSYLSRMADELGISVDKLIAADGDVDRILPGNVMTGAWFGLHLATDRFGQNYVIEEDTHLVQKGTRVEGYSDYETSDGKMRDHFVDCTFKDNVFCGQMRPEDWPFPLDSAVFVVSGTRNIDWLLGYISWFDLDSEQTEFSKYVMIRQGSENFETEVANARRLLESEDKLLRARRFLETGYDFEKVVALMVATEAAPPARALGDTAQAASAPARSVPGDDLPSTASTAAGIVVAMSPLTVLDADPTEGYFADGLIDDIATDLASAPGLDVLPRMTFPDGETVTPAAAGRAGATHLLSGTLRRSEKRLRVNAQLVETAQGRIVWAERYDQPSDAVFATQDAISRDVVATLCRELASGAPLSGESAKPDPRAYEVFLKGRSLYLRGMNIRTLRAALALMTRAVEIDPGYARAHAQISICQTYLLLSITLDKGEAPTIDGLEASQRALAIDPDLALAHAALGLARYGRGEYGDAEIALRDAVRRDPKLFEAQFFLARNLRLQGDRAGAAERFEIATRLRPDDFRARGLLGEELQALGRSDAAMEHFRAALTLIEAELGAHPDNAGALAFGAAVLADLDRADRANVWAEWALTIAPEDCLVHYNTARMHALLGNTGEAAAHLSRAFDTSPTAQRRLALWMRHDEDLEPLANNRQFQSLLKFGETYA
jgi:TolB-like protein/tetratricopeptide (TPR) repeat protein